MSRDAVHAADLPWLIFLAALDVLILLLVLFPEALTGRALASTPGFGRLMAVALIPVPTLLLGVALPNGLKVILIYWRIRYASPEHRAFTEHAAADPRVDTGALRENVGALPDDPEAQNKLWRKLYHQVDMVVTVVESHRAYLLFRDMAAISFFVLVFALTALIVMHARQAQVWGCATIFFMQYVATAWTARRSGIRFVGAVLAQHGTKRARPQPAVIERSIAAPRGQSDV